MQNHYGRNLLGDIRCAMSQLCGLMFQFAVAVSLTVVPELSWASSSCEQLGEASADSAAIDRQLDATDKCLERLDGDVRAVEHALLIINQLPARETLTDSQERVLAEISNIRSQVLELAKVTISISPSGQQGSVISLQAVDRELGSLEAKLKELRVQWPSRMRFPSNSKAWDVLRIVRDSSVPPDVRSVLVEIKESFPRAYWGEKDDEPIEALDSSDALIAEARKLLAVKSALLSTNIMTSVSAAVSQTMQPARVAQLASFYRDKVLEGVAPDRVERRACIFSMNGLVILPKDEINDAIEALQLARSRMPRAFVGTAAAEIENAIRRLEQVRGEISAGSIQKAAGTIRTSLSNMKVLTERLMPNCSRSSGPMAGWWDSANEKADLILDALRNAPASSAHARTRHILAEQAFVELYEIQEICRKRSAL